MPREEARARVLPHGAAGAFEWVVGGLVQDGRITARDRLALASHRVELVGDEAAARERIERVFRDGGLRPPDPADLAAALQAAPATCEKIVALLIRQRVLVRVETLVFHQEALASLKEETRALKAAAPGGTASVDVAGFKERYGITRKFAIPLLEYLDRERVTRRVGDRRVVI
jgi:selenocysteine-specific elongation factor